MIRALVFLLLFLSPCLITEAQWYASNGVGVLGEAIDPSEADDHEYVLHISTDNGIEIRQLLHDGDEVNRTTIERSGITTTETEYEDRVLATRRVYDSEGCLTTEELYDSGELEEFREYEYAEGRLFRRRVFDADSALLQLDTYAYWSDGSLRSILREDGAVTEYRYSGGRLDEEWVSRGETEERYVYDRQGRLTDRWLWSAGEITERETREYWGAGPESPIKSIVIIAGEETTTRGYDNRGRLVSREVSREGVVVLQRWLAYSGDLLVQEVERESGETRTWEYEYVDQELDKTTYLEGNTVVKVSVHRTESDEFDRIDYIYRNGEVALRAYFTDGRRVKEEVLRDGEVILTRMIDAEEGADE
jgi:hypothetical protein